MDLTCGNVRHRFTQLIHPEVFWIGRHTSAREIYWAVLEALVTTGKGQSSVSAVCLILARRDSSGSNDSKVWARGHFLHHLWPSSYLKNGRLVARELHLLTAPLQERTFLPLWPWEGKWMWINKCDFNWIDCLRAKKAQGKLSKTNITVSISFFLLGKMWLLNTLFPRKHPMVVPKLY